MVKMFATRKEAEHWADENERSIRMAGLPLTIDDLKKVTVGNIVRRYLEEKTPQKASAEREEIVLKRLLLKRDISHLSLASISGQKKYAYGYIADRLKDTWRGKSITPRTVRREINSIQHVFEVAREEWGYTNLANPFRDIHVKGSMHRRRRRLEIGELEKLEAACKQCLGLNKYYVRLAIHLAIETGMRLQEIFNLTWADVNLETRRIEIRKSKTDYLSDFEGRTIVMTRYSLFCLMQLVDHLELKRKDVDKRIFPMEKEAFKQAWANLVKRAGINPSGEERRRLTFHDLRREAGSRFDEAGLTKGEHDLMMGHTNKDMTSLYIHGNLEAIEEKIDRYSFKGEYDKIVAEAKANDMKPGAYIRNLVVMTMVMARLRQEENIPLQVLLDTMKGDALKDVNVSNVVPFRSSK